MQSEPSSFQHFLTQLSLLSCPFTARITNWSEILHPCETRWKLLEWLLLCIDPSISSHVKVKETSSNEEQNTIQRITAYASFACVISSTHDSKIIQGSTSPSSQIAFLSRLASMALLAQPTLVSESTDVSELEYARCFALLSDVSSHYREIFDTSSPIPVPQGTLLEKLQQPSLAELERKLKKLDISIKGCESEIEQLNLTIRSVVGGDVRQISAEAYEERVRELEEQLKSFNSLIAEFQRVFPREIQPWLKQQPAQFSQTHSLTQHITQAKEAQDQIAKLFSAFDTVRSSYTTCVSVMDQLRSLSSEDEHLGERKIQEMKEAVSVLDSAKQRRARAVVH